MAKGAGLRPFRQISGLTLSSSSPPVIRNAIIETPADKFTFVIGDCLQPELINTGRDRFSMQWISFLARQKRELALGEGERGGYCGQIVWGRRSESDSAVGDWVYIIKWSTF